jgi:2-iminobutanoate/2-iminopropanoate deaminase
MRDVIHTDDAPAAVGPYSQAILAGGLVWCSGQIALDPATGVLVTGGVEAETRRVLQNLQAVLQAAGSDIDRVVKATLYLVDMADFEVVNRLYGEMFGESPPARVCIQVSRLPKDARIELDAVALPKG